MIQGMYHARKSRALLKMLIRAIYTKVQDEQGNVYYYNNRTGESQVGSKQERPLSSVLQTAHPVPHP